MRIRIIIIINLTTIDLEFFQLILENLPMKKLRNQNEQKKYELI